MPLRNRTRLSMAFLGRGLNISVVIKSMLQAFLVSNCIIMYAILVGLEWRKKILE